MPDGIHLPSASPFAADLFPLKGINFASNPYIGLEWGTGHWAQSTQKIPKTEVRQPLTRYPVVLPLEVPIKCFDTQSLFVAYVAL